MDKIKVNEQIAFAIASQYASIVTDESFNNKNLFIGHILKERIFHYTSLATLVKIIENQTLWATDINCLNDKTEFKHGITLIKKILSGTTTESNRLLFKSLEEEMYRLTSTERYVVCFSNDGDLKSQWREYGFEGKGVSIGFNRRNLKSSLTQNLIGKYLLYDIDKQEQVLNILVQKSVEFFLSIKDNFGWNPYRFEQFAAVRILDFLQGVISDYKNSSFKEELEYRLEYSIELTANKRYKPDIKFRGNKRNIIPFVELETEYHYLQRTKKKDEIMPTLLLKQLPIEEIVIGPSLDFDSVSYGIKKLLEKHNYSNIELKPSSIPYRL